MTATTTHTALSEFMSTAKAHGWTVEWDHSLIGSGVRVVNADRTRAIWARFTATGRVSSADLLGEHDGRLNLYLDSIGPLMRNKRQELIRWVQVHAELGI